jgi:hypothetical protein
MERTMAHKQKHRNSSSKALSGPEADAQLLREKTARLRELRLAHEAATAAANPVVKKVATKAKPAKPSKKKPPLLSEWLDTQQKEGRRG